MKDELRIWSPIDSPIAISRRLQVKLPLMLWQDSDSAWDKVNVWGTSAEAHVRIYRYEAPGPFRLTITLNGEGPDGEQAVQELRRLVLEAIEGSLWQPPLADPQKL